MAASQPSYARSIIGLMSSRCVLIPAVLVLAALALPQAHAVSSPRPHLAALQRAAAQHPASASAHAALGMALSDARRWSQAIAELSTAVHLKAGDPHLLYNLGIAHILRATRASRPGTVAFFNDLDGAFQALLRASQLQPGLPNIHGHLGWLYQQLGDHASAVREFQRAIQQDPRSAAAYNNLGTALAGEQQYQAAAAAYIHALLLDPTLTLAGIDLASALRQWHHEDAEIQEAQKRVRESPTSGLAHALLGYTLFLNDQPALASVELRTGVQLAPNLALTHYYWGELLRAQNQLVPAETQYRAALRLQPHTAAFLMPLGFAYLAQKQCSTVIAVLRQGLHSQPDSAAAHYGLARALRCVGQATEAKREFEKAATLRQQSLLLSRADLATVNGIRDLQAHDPASAAKSLEQAVMLAPNYPEASYYLGIALAQSGDEPGANAAFQRALRWRPESAEIHYNFGIALWQQGHAAAAIGEFRRTVALDPNHALAHCALGLALLRLGEAAEADIHLRRARALGACQPKS